MIYRHYQLSALNDQYDTRKSVPEFADYFRRWEDYSFEARQSNRYHKDLYYGDNPLECIDIFPAATPLSKTIVFIHGGYWHLLDKNMFHFLANEFVRRDITSAFINYPLAPSASIEQIVSSCRNAMLCLYKNIESHNGDPLNIHVTGHSAGGHLATMLLLDNRQSFIKSVTSFSGIFNLEPVFYSQINAVLRMSREEALNNSPAFFKPLFDCPLYLFTGGDETGEFKHQTETLHTNWKNSLSNIRASELPGRNHYSVLDAAADFIL